MYYEIRQLPDRRRRPTPMLGPYLFRGRRQTASRRADDSRGGYLDRIDPLLGLLLGAVFFFHILDAVFTLIHLRQGAAELNPFMRLLLDRHEGLFVGVKLGLAALGLLFLALHQNFPHVRKAASLLFVVFGLLLGYHLLVFAVPY